MYVLCPFYTSVSFKGAHSWYFDFNNCVSVTSCCWYYAEGIYINRKSKLLTVSKTSEPVSMCNFHNMIIFLTTVSWFNVNKNVMLSL